MAMKLREWFREWSGMAQDERAAATRERFIIDALGKLSGQLERIEKKQEPVPSLRPPTPRPAAPVDWEQAQLQALYDLESDPKKGN
jgi:hypothetical protein